MKKLIHRLANYPTKPSNIAQYLNTTPKKNPYPRHLGFTKEHMGIHILHATEIHERDSQQCTSIGVHTNQQNQPLFCIHTRIIAALPPTEQIKYGYNLNGKSNNPDHIKIIKQRLFLHTTNNQPNIRWENYPHHNPNAMPWTLQQIIFRQNPLSQHEYIQYMRSIEKVSPRGINCRDLTDKPLHIAPPQVIFIPQRRPTNYDQTIWESKIQEYKDIEKIQHKFYLLIHPRYICITQQNADTKRWYIESLHAQ